MAMTQASMTSAAAIIIASNTSRKQLTLNNIGTKTVYIGKNASVVSSTNNANGGYPILASEIFYLHDYSGDIYGICDGADTSTIAVLEEAL